MNKLYGTYKNRGLELLAINKGEGKDAVEKTVKEKGMKYKVLLDSSKKVSELYKVETIPRNILIDLKGKIAYDDEHIPDEGVVNKTLPQN